jgi:hypothetical protein
VKRFALIVAAFFVCKVDDKTMECMPCGKPDDYCLWTFTVAKKLADFKQPDLSAQALNDKIDDQVMILKGMIENLEIKLKEKHP